MTREKRRRAINLLIAHDLDDFDMFAVDWVSIMRHGYPGWHQESNERLLEEISERGLDQHLESSEPISEIFPNIEVYPE